MITVKIVDKTYLDLIKEAKKQIIDDVLKKVIPPSLEAVIHRTSWRRQLLEKCGKKAFLDPDNLEYPVMTPNCKYHCGLLYAAYIRSSQWHRKKIRQKAMQLYEKNGCEQKLGINIRKAKA